MVHPGNRTMDVQEQPREQTELQTPSNPANMYGLLTYRYSDEAVPPTVWPSIRTYTIGTLS